MHTTACTLGQAAYIINSLGLHHGPQFADSSSPALDICAAVYLAAENTLPAEFHTDETVSLALIEASAGAMGAIRAISDVLGPVCETEVLPGFWVPDYVEHVSSWATPIDGSTPPSTSEVIGCILRAANTLAVQTPTATAA